MTCGRRLSSFAESVEEDHAASSAKAEPGASPPSSLTGRIIGGHYRILDKIGSGGMGVVYKARDERLHRLVALKVLPAAVAEDGESRDRFFNEARAAAALNHPNIAIVHALEEIEDSLFIVMEYIEGQDLKKRLLAGRLDAREAGPIALQVARGLDAAHRAGILHRDVKPANIMISGPGRVKITDFGLAKIEQAGDLTRTGTKLGTVAYMSPEQVRGDRVDHRSDIWSLGVVIFEMLFGRSPFATGQWQAVMYSILSDPLRFPEDPVISPACRRALEGCLEKDPNLRHASVKVLAADLTEWVKEGEAVNLDEDATLLMPASPEVPSGTGDCPDCGALNVLGASFCRECGISLSSASAEPSGSPAARPAASGSQHSGRSISMSRSERRQVTVLCSEAVPVAGSNADPEDLQEFWNEYQRRFRKVVERFEGTLSHDYGEILLANFGFPLAHEDDAKRAVLAGLRLLDEMAPLREQFESERDFRFEIRICAHTGLAVAAGGREESESARLVADTPRLATRMVGTAPADSLIISDATHPLVARHFDCRVLSAPGTTGVSSLLYQVMGEISRAPKGLAQAAPKTTLVGRSQEAGLMLDRWERAKHGLGQVVLLSGEPGIGKSRLVGMLREHVSNQTNAQALELQCSPYFQQSAFQPLISHFENDLLRFQKEDSAEAKLHKLEGFLLSFEFDLSETVPLLQTLLSIPFTGKYLPSKLPPDRQKAKILQTILTLLQRQSKRRPTLLIVEDLQWADPSTGELIQLVVDQGPSSPLYSLLTFRPEYQAPWGERSHITRIILGRLSQGEIESVIASVAGGKNLPADILAQLVRRSDGVPLFVEEMTKTVLESTQLRQLEDRYELIGKVSPAIPVTLRESLLARLDRLESAKGVAQLASTLGRDFPFDWLRELSPLNDPELTAQLEKLVKAELLYQLGVAPEARYLFKHALIQEAAYESLLKSDRQKFHRQIAEMLSTRFAQEAEARPELLAHHLTEAGLDADAVVQWQKAGRLAIRRSANLEAISHLSTALQLTRRQPDSPARVQTELDLLVAMGGPRIATSGYASPEVGKLFGEARELCQNVGDSPLLFEALQGLWAYYLVRADLNTALGLGRRLLELSDNLGDDGLSMEAALRLGITQSMLGDLQPALSVLESAAEKYHPVRHQSHGYKFGQDPLVACLCHQGLVLWLLGWPDRAIAACREAVRIGGEISHTFSLAWALFYEALVHTLRREAGPAAAKAASLARLCEENGFSYRLAQARILLGWSRVMAERRWDGLSQMRDGIEAVLSTGALVYQPCYLALQADALATMGRVGEGLEAVERALPIMAETGERFFEPELIRLKGELLLKRTPSDREGARGCFQDSIEKASAGGTKPLQLRAALSLVRMGLDGAAGSRALAELAETVDGFKEGFETQDLREAKQVLAETN